MPEWNVNYPRLLLFINQQTPSTLIPTSTHFTYH